MSEFILKLISMCMFVIALGGILGIYMLYDVYTYGTTDNPKQDMVCAITTLIVYGGILYCLYKRIVIYSAFGYGILLLISMVGVVTSLISIVVIIIDELR